MMKTKRNIFAALIPVIILIAVSCTVTAAGNADRRYSCALYCVDDKELLAGENIDKAIAPASLTKLLTAAVALRYVSADAVFAVGTELDYVNYDSSYCLIAPGQRLKLYDLASGMLLASGNDAAYTVAVNTARRVSGSELTDDQAVKYFCVMMNDLAAELGMNGSHFENPDGWDNAEHYTTVSDLVKLAEYALTVPEIREIASVHQRYVVFESGENITWTNSNRLLDPDDGFYCESAVGLKTGTTDKAGCCLIGAFVRDGKTYVTVVAGCGSDGERYEKTLGLLERI